MSGYITSIGSDAYTDGGSLNPKILLIAFSLSTVLHISLVTVFSWEDILSSKAGNKTVPLTVSLKYNTPLSSATKTPEKASTSRNVEKKVRQAKAISPEVISSEVTEKVIPQKTTVVKSRNGDATIDKFLESTVKEKKQALTGLNAKEESFVLKQPSPSREAISNGFRVQENSIYNERGHQGSTIFDPKLREKLEKSAAIDKAYKSKLTNDVYSFTNSHGIEVVVNGDQCFKLIKSNDVTEPTRWSLPYKCPHVKTEADKITEAMRSIKHK